MVKLRKSALSAELQSIAEEDYLFRNWAKTFQCRCELLFRPKTEAQISEVVKLATKHGKTVRVFGSGHSPSDLAMTPDVMVNIDDLNQLLSVDKANHRVTVQAGMSLHKLHEVLAENGLAMRNLGSISDQSVAGIMSTATHGTGANFGCLSTMVLDCTLITADGSTLYVSAKENTDVFHAVRCGLGALGVIVRATLDVEPAYRLEAIQKPYRFSDVLADWHNVIYSSEHSRIWWMPHTNDCVVWRANRTEKPAQPPKERWWLDRGIGVHLYQFLLNVGRYRPAIIPSVTNFMFDTFFRKPVHVIDDSYKVFMFDVLFPQYVNEWAVDWDEAPKVLRELEQFINSSDLKVHYPVEIRFVEEDDIWLSPSYGRKTCYIGVIMYRPYGLPVSYKKYWQAYENIMRAHGGRPHWAKVNTSQLSLYLFVYVALFRRTDKRPNN
ncbi:D-arabinono-1,4-lactone oxidase-domain-containing protein [Syncephalastrum racemosum]|uniref:D-arabinono-1,4-lactone oxidase n=1 Tax=Syncephalastrum racemosum TaxID=13706 RepID=A0A1X2H0U3_SYNRA|nr:D-arabinono-1,4-lactone oxidase-domain-containing protein [Syncephalastrum racemosum]